MEKNEPDNIKALVSAPSVPGKPIGTPGNGQVFLSWTAPSDNGGSAITDYIIQRQMYGQSWFVNITDDVVSPATSITTTGLSNGTPYTFRVRAVNSSGLLSDFSENSNLITPRTVPSAPTWFAHTPFNGYIQLHWIAPNNGGSPITDYIIQRKAFGEPDSAYVTINDGASTSTFLNVSNLTQGIKYRFRIAAVNAAGIGAYSIPTPAVLFATSPEKPNPPVCVRGNAQITLSWTAPNSGGSPITDYIIQRKVNGALDSTYVTISDGVSTNTNYTNTGLTNGTLYVFRVAAVNSVGSSVFSNPSIPIRPATIPNAPTGLAASPNNNGTITLSWIAPYDGGATITDYIISGKLSSQSDSTYSIISDSVTSATNAIVTKTPPGPFTFRVAAVNARGTGAYSSASNSVNSVPAVPTNLVANPTGNGQITLSWNAPNNGGSPITDYVIQYKLNNEVSPWIIYNDGTSSNNTAVVNGLENNYYVFKVAARNIVGLSNYSNSSIPVKPYMLFNKNSWSNIGNPWRGYLDAAADRWSKYIMIDPYLESYIKNNIDSGWNGIELSEGGFNSLSIPPVNDELPLDAQTTEVGIINFGETTIVTLDFRMSANSWWQNRTVALSDNTTLTQTDENWREIFFHELGHVLGIGTYWNKYNTEHAPLSYFFLDGSVLTQTQQGYNTVAGVSESLIPIESGGGTITAGTHWENNYRPKEVPLVGGYPGIINDLMSQNLLMQSGAISIRVPRVLSLLTIKNLVDYGYLEVNPGASEGSPMIDTGVVTMMNYQPDKIKCNCNCVVKKVAEVDLINGDIKKYIQKNPR